MITIENSIHVNTLFLTWQSNIDRNQRYLVGALKRTDDGFEFSYMTETQDFIDAKEQGFQGYPAFPLNKGPFTNDVTATFMKRLPPRSRRDFKKYLTNHHLSEDFQGCDFDLIAHTGIKLPSDGFDLIPNLEEAELPFEYLMEVAGTRYYLNYGQVTAIKLDTPVELRCENDNKYDCQAIAMFVDGVHIGYVNKLFCKTVRKLMLRDLECRVAQISGTEERPLIYVILAAK
ncbi:HIRAN domain-containing protein [Vibrio cholerae]|uniref:HIRAN domain-containing protein n=1 Tax=Vibrio cholerae TaxID=666 RepID=UPI00084D20FD|nr:HIRAN domain-containing protein [Vibrio cholerae]EGQ9395100.1 hypothetical protein [Vibrio cholerae]EKG0409507.1 HIRAN domain-containing protein [Vibrio cholerae]OEG78133.1 hypothetical protein VCS12_07245 [Vibrio cholerae]